MDACINPKRSTPEIVSPKPEDTARMRVVLGSSKGRERGKL